MEKEEVRQANVYDSDLKQIQKMAIDMDIFIPDVIRKLLHNYLNKK